MRATSFVNKLEFEINGNVMKDAVELGDVDNDERDELAVGTVNGDLFIFKECFSNKPWIAANGLGMITSVVVGDITNSQTNSLVVVSGEGFCHIFNVFTNTQDEDNQKKLHLRHMQQLPSSAKMVVLADIDGDGNLELVIGLTDRVVRSYRWTHLPTNSEGSGSDTLIALNKWELANQIGSVSVHTNPDGKNCLLVAQPGAMYVQLDCDASIVEKTSQTKELMIEMPLEYQSAMPGKQCNSSMTTEVLGDVHCKSGKSHFAVATLDGVLMLVDGATGDPVWCLNLEHQLFSLSKLDVTNDGREEVVVSSWDGDTYIVDYEQNVLQFHLDDSVSSFRAGKYSSSPESGNSPCLVFATLSNRVVLYYDIRLPRIPLNTLISEMSSQSDHKHLFKQIGIQCDDEKKIRQLYNYCLYGCS